MPEPILQIDAILTKALAPKLGFDEKDVQEQLTDALNDLYGAVTLAKEYELLDKTSRERIMRLLTGIEQFGEQLAAGQVKSSRDLFKLKEEIVTVERSISSLLSARCQRSESVVKKLKELASLLSVQSDVEVPDWSSDLSQGEYSKLRTDISLLERHQKVLEKEIEGVLSSKNWPQAMMELFRKLRQGIDLKSLTDDEWALLNVLRKDQLASKIELKVG